MKRQGLQEKVVKLNQDPGYLIEFGICTRCGEETVKTSKDAYQCPSCHTRNKDTFKLNADRIAPQVVRDIINRRTVYICPECKRQYARITPCCVASHAISEKQAYDSVKRQGFQRGWYCTGCKTIYDTKVSCCEDGYLIPGKFMADPLQTKRALLGI